MHSAGAFIFIAFLIAAIVMASKPWVDGGRD